MSAAEPSTAAPLAPAEQFDAAARPSDDGYQAVLDCYLGAASQSLDSWWAAAFTAADASYSSPGVQAFDDAVSTVCGDATADTGPFYCPADQTIYLQGAFMTRIGDETGAQGPYSGVIVLAHEWAHHVQALMGMDEAFHAAVAEALGGANVASTRTELMADCMAGWWSGMADQTGQFPVTEQDVLDAVLSLAEVGDDFQTAIAALDEAAKCTGVPPGFAAPLPPVAVGRIARGPIVINATADPRTPLDAARAMAGAFTGARLVAYDSTQQVVWLQTGSACVNDAVTRYVLLRRLPATDVACPLARGR